MPKHEAQAKLADYIEYTGRITKQGSAICTFADLWKRLLCRKIWPMVKEDTGKISDIFLRNTSSQS